MNNDQATVTARPDSPPPDRNARGRGFCFTLHNYTFAEEEALHEQLGRVDGVYLITGREICPTTGTPHLQGYIHFPNARTWSAIRRLFGTIIGHDRCHIKVARGSPRDNYIYCSKGGDFRELGTCPNQGGRSDLDAVTRDITEGKFPESSIDHVSRQDHLRYCHQSSSSIY